MEMMLREMVILIFFSIFSSLSFGNEFLPENTDIDSLNVYYDLIAEENYNANYKPNVTGMIVGGSLTGIGSFLAAVGMYELFKGPDDDSKSLSGAFDAIGRGAFVACTLMGSIPFLGVGIPVLAYNIYQYNVHKGHANKRDEYQKALDSYKKRISMRIIILPSINVVENGGGVKAFFLF